MANNNIKVSYERWDHNKGTFIESVTFIEKEDLRDLLWHSALCSKNAYGFPEVDLFDLLDNVDRVAVLSQGQYFIVYTDVHSGVDFLAFDDHPIFEWRDSLIGAK